MIADIIKQRNTILEKIEKAGIPRSNLSSVLLYGSHYWGYDRPDSDIDLYLVLKKKQEKAEDFENISLLYQITYEELVERVKQGGWSSFFCSRYASYLLYGQRPKVPDYPKERIIEYLNKKRGPEVEKISGYPRRKAFQIVMWRIYFLNYYFNNIATFKLNDFQYCRQLSDSEIAILEEQYVKVFEHAPEDKSDNKRPKALTLKLEKIIEDKIEK